MKRNFEIKKSVKENMLGDGEKVYSIILNTKDPVIYQSAENVLSEVTVGKAPLKVERRARMISLILDYDEHFDNSVANVDSLVRFVDYLQKNGIETEPLDKYKGTYATYCNKHSSCDKCDKKVRRLCEKKSKLIERIERVIRGIV